MSRLRLGFVGAGSMGQAAHLRNYVTLPDCEVVALAEVRPKLARGVADRYGIPAVYADHGEMIRDEKLDGIVAIQQFQNHVRLIPDLVEFGLPVITEKPLAESVQNGRKILESVKGSLYLAYHKRSDPATEYAVQTITSWKESGEAGRLRYVRITMPPGDWAWDGFASNVTTDEAYESTPFDLSSPYVMFVNYYIHQVNLMRFLLGEDYEVVYADPGGITLCVRTGSGVSGTLEMAPYETPHDWQESALVAFEKGWIRIDLPAPLAYDQSGRVTIYREGYSQPALPHVHAMKAQASNFLKAIRGEPHPLCGAEEAFKDLLVAERYLELAAAK
jgi:predicted dehydrogenase